MNASRFGMKVNQAKTQLMCVSAAINSKVSSYVRGHDGANIDSTDNMTLLGFKFSSKPTVDAHISLIVHKFNIRVWLIRHLLQAGVKQSKAALIYTTVVRPVIEYAVPVYHPMLSECQAKELEKLQRRMMKIIFGYKISYKKAMEMANLPTLAHRRQEITKKFATKLAASGNFDRWLPTHHPYQYELRNVLRYEEETAHTNWLYRSPIYTYRRMLNSACR